MNRIIKNLIRQCILKKDEIRLNNECIERTKEKIKRLELRNKELEEDVIDIKCITTEIGIDFEKCYKEYK